MWRSKTRSFLFRFSTQAYGKVKSQVPRTVALAPVFSYSRSSKWFIATGNNYNVPRFFSDSISDPPSEDDTTSTFLEAISGENNGLISQEGDVNEEYCLNEGDNDVSVEEEDVGGEEKAEEEKEEIVQGSKMNRVQVENVLSLLQSTFEGSLEAHLEKMNLELNEDFVMSVIQTPYVPGENLIEFFKWTTKNSDVRVTTQILYQLVRSVCISCRKKEVYSLWALVKKIGQNEKELITTEILNEFISARGKLGKGKETLEVFNKFEEFECDPDANTYYLMIRALCSRSMFDNAWLICEQMINSGILPTTEKIEDLISCFCKGGKAKDAHFVYLVAKERNQLPSRRIVNFLISRLCKKDETVSLALETLDYYSGDARRYAIKPFSAVIRGLCRMKDTEEAKKLLFQMIKMGPIPGNAVFNYIISALSKAGEMTKAIELVRLMESRGLRPDIFTYCVIMSGYSAGGQMDDACKIFSEAKKKHSKLNPLIYHILIRGFCKLEEFNKAVEYLNEMKEKGVKPNLDEYKKLIQSLCLKAVDWNTSEKLLEEMKETGLYLNGMTRSLIKAVRSLEEEDLIQLE